MRWSRYPWEVTSSPSHMSSTVCFFRSSIGVIVFMSDRQHYLRRRSGSRHGQRRSDRVRGHGLQGRPGRAARRARENEERAIVPGIQPASMHQNPPQKQTTIPAKINIILHEPNHSYPDPTRHITNYKPWQYLAIHIMCETKE